MCSLHQSHYQSFMYALFQVSFGMLDFRPSPVVQHDTVSLSCEMLEFVRDSPIASALQDPRNEFVVFSRRFVFRGVWPFRAFVDLNLERILSHRFLGAQGNGMRFRKMY